MILSFECGAGNETTQTKQSKGTLCPIFLIALPVFKTYRVVLTTLGTINTVAATTMVVCFLAEVPLGCLPQQIPVQKPEGFLAYSVVEIAQDTLYSTTVHCKKSAHLYVHIIKPVTFELNCFRNWSQSHF